MSAQTPSAAMRVAVVVPTYNEAENLGPLAEQLLALPGGIEILCVDDASPDGTGQLAEEIASASLRFHVIHRTSGRGFAASNREGLAWALARGFDVACTMDADLSHDPAVLPAMLARTAAGADLVIGSRYVEGGGLEVEWGPVRRAVSQMGSAYARAMLGTPVRDCTSGYRCYRASALAALDLAALRSEGYGFQIEMLAALAATGATIEEYPITYVDRQRGESKISPGMVVEALAETTRLGMRRAIGLQ